MYNRAHGKPGGITRRIMWSVRDINLKKNNNKELDIKLTEMKYIHLCQP